MINMPGGPEILVIFLVALVVLGPQQLPKAMRTFGNVMAEVRKISTSFQAEMRSAMDTIVDTSAEEKPQSAKMAPATPVDSDPVSEVVARNDAAPSAEARDGSDDADVPEAWSPGGEPAAPAADDAPTRPAVDPADRAAG